MTSAHCALTFCLLLLAVFILLTFYSQTETRNNVIAVK